MAPSDETRLDGAELEQLLRDADPAALLVKPRILRRIIKHDRGLTGLGLQVPHRKSYVIDRDSLLRIVDKTELDYPARKKLPPTVLLIARPDPDRLAALPRGEALVKYWRMLFHGRVHMALESRRARRRLTEAGLRHRIARIGQAEFAEIRAVLRDENYLLPPGDDRTAYVEFAALYLELRYFAPALLRRYFPAVTRYEDLDAILAEDLDADRLFARTWLAGAPDPVVPAEKTDADCSTEENPLALGHRGHYWPLSEGLYRQLIAGAERASTRGNLVRAAILRMRAARGAAPGRSGDTRAGAVAELDRLAFRLGAALHLSEAETETWRRVLPALLENAARGIWPVEARLLYDVQKVCVDHEKEIFAVDLVEWIISLGWRPVRRLLPHQREVLIPKHLRSAARRLTAVRLAKPDRQRLAALLGAAIHDSEARLRERFRPLIREVLDRVGLHPQNFPERVALDKLTEELLDRITERGFLTMSALRDALARNQLKLPDLSGPREFLLGDQLIRANSLLADALDGVYRRGEVYLRWLQGLSSLAFGTRPGRLLTRYVALPFGGAFVSLEGLEHVVALVPGTHPHLVGPVSVGLLGAFLLGLLNVPAFRQRVGHLFRLTYRGLRGLVVDLPAFLLRLPLVRHVVESRTFALFLRYAFKPLVLTTPVAIGLLFAGADAATAAGGGTAFFLAACLFLNTRLGLQVEEILTDWVIRLWWHIRLDLLPGLFHLVMEFFKQLLELVERLLYSVDEWLRFRSGDSRLSLVVKPFLGLVWSGVTYVVRFCVNVLIEPQINPIKHFPVVTVSHKLLLPFIPTLAGVLALTMDKKLAYTLAPTIITAIPGVFGFLVWELKENWRLYQANRSPTLRPVLIGHHGETLARFLRPGFHSGTLPKLYAKLRRAERTAHQTGARKAARKHRQALHLVEECLRHFVEREFVSLLNESRGWLGLRIAAGEIGLGSNRIRFEFACPGLEGVGLVIALEERSGWLLAGVLQPGWLPQLSAEQRQMLANALAGLYKLGGVDLVREQIEAYLDPQTFRFAVEYEGLVVRPAAAAGGEAVYDLRNGPVLPRQPSPGSPPLALPELVADHLLLKRVPVPWQHWVDVWERDQSGMGPPEPVLDGWRLLPGS
jgi:hypothetical protein